MMRWQSLGVFAPLLANPVVRRAGWHLRRVAGQIDLRFFRSLALFAGGPAAQEDPQRAIGEAADDEGQDVLGNGIQPLHVPAQLGLTG